VKRAARPKLASAKERAPLILARLKAAYPEASTALDFENAYQLLVATILSAQCTDTRVNMVTPEVFRRFPNPAVMARALVANHGGEVPNTMEELHALPGVGRKTANVVLGNAFGINVGVTVDTHVARLSQRLRLTPHDDPVKIERDLMPLFPQADWALLSHLLIFHGRQVCIARRPRCDACVLADLCPSARIP